jgi:hypothetical protein
VKAQDWAFRRLFEPEVVRFEGGKIVCHGGMLSPGGCRGGVYYIFL